MKKFLQKVFWHSPKYIKLSTIDDYELLTIGNDNQKLKEDKSRNDESDGQFFK